MAERTASWLLGRPVDEGDEAWLDGLTAGFVGSGYRYRALVREIVRSDRYRTVR